MLRTPEVARRERIGQERLGNRVLVESASEIVHQGAHRKIAPQWAYRSCDWDRSEVTSSVGMQRITVVSSVGTRRG